MNGETAGVLVGLAVLVAVGAHGCHEEKKHRDQIDRIEAQAREANDRLVAIEERLNID